MLRRTSCMVLLSFTCITDKKMACKQYLDSRCVFAMFYWIAAPLEPGVPTKTCLESRSYDDVRKFNSHSLIFFFFLTARWEAVLQQFAGDMATPRDYLKVNGTRPRRKRPARGEAVLRHRPVADTLAWVVCPMLCRVLHILT